MKSRLRTIGATGAVVLTAMGIFAATYTGGKEGKRNHAYRDIVGVVTICYGETAGGVKMGDYKTDAECRELLGESLVKHEQGMRKCLSDPDGIPPNVYVTALDLTFNVGVGAFCKSTMRRRINARDYRGACDAVMAFTKGRIRGELVDIPGLVNRRRDNRALCLRDLP